MSEQVIRVGVVGTGHIANQRHIPEFRTAGAAVLAVADVVEERAKRMAAKWEIPHAFGDYHDMLALSELDAVSVCVPPIAHKEVALAAFEAGKHVYIEKPPAMNEAEMTAIVAAGRAAGKLLLVGSNSVYWSQTRTLKRMIDNGDLGTIYLVKSLGAGRRNIPRGWFRSKALSGGGVGMDGGSHSLDRVLYLIGTPQPVSVTARTYDHFADVIPRSGYLAIDIEEGTQPDVPRMDVEDTVVAFVQFEDGCTLVLENAWASNISGGGGTWFYGTKAGASLHPFAIYSENRDGVLMDTTPVVPSGPSTHLEAFQHFLSCIRDGRDTDSNGERSIVTMRILDAIYRSASEGGREVRFG